MTRGWWGEFSWSMTVSLIWPVSTAGAVASPAKQNRQQRCSLEGGLAGHTDLPTLPGLNTSHDTTSTHFMAAGWMKGGMPRIAMFRFMPGGGGTKEKGRGGLRPMLRVLESAMRSVLA